MKRLPRTEAEWLDEQERSAREGVRRAIVGLGEDAAHALNVRALKSDHPDLAYAIDQVGQALGSDAVLSAIETSVAAAALPPEARGGIVRKLLSAFSRSANAH